MAIGLRPMRNQVARSFVRPFEAEFSAWKPVRAVVFRAKGFGVTPDSVATACVTHVLARQRHAQARHADAAALCRHSQQQGLVIEPFAP
jgi:hypothetical protein